jgi:hypothetical protein
MPITRDSLVQDCRQALAGGDTPAARERIAGLLGQALRDPAFVAAQFAQPVSERQIAYEDPDLGFCVLLHAYDGAARGGPHDHGPSWAIYGQAAGETLMREYALVEPPAPGRRGTVREASSYTMRPGDVHHYPEGTIHAPERFGPTRLVRIEGCDLAKVARGSYEVIG